jgi:hypothetical protein
VKPWSPPDRWDDSTPIAGYTGGAKGVPDWRNNGRWDGEAFTDLNGNALHDAGEPFVDGNHNGKYDAELYDPARTGYFAVLDPGGRSTPNGDVGRKFVLALATSDQPTLGQYLPIGLPPINRGGPIHGAGAYRDNIESCNDGEVWPGDWIEVEPGNMAGPTSRGMSDLIALDPNAWWDPITQSVQGSAFGYSPRIVLLPLRDPRIAIAGGRGSFQVARVVRFFMEGMQGIAAPRGRLVSVVTASELCPPSVATGGSVVNRGANAVGSRPPTWGQVKDIYRK